MKNLILLFSGLLFSANAFAVPYTGFYQTIDDETNLPKSIVALNWQGVLLRCMMKKVI